MSECNFCGNQRVKSYADCDCWQAKKLKRQMAKGGRQRGEQALDKCEECDLQFIQKDIQKVFNNGTGKWDQRYECPRCGHLQVTSESIIKEKYR